MQIGPRLILIAGAVVVALGGFATAQTTGPAMAQHLGAMAERAIAAQGATGVEARFTNDFGMPTRHPLLMGGRTIDDEVRAQVARTVAALPGVGGVFWADGTIRVKPGELQYEPLHCQDDVEALLRTRSIRFLQGSSALLPASEVLLGEVARALTPCVGAIIAITGHTDDRGEADANISLSMDRARAVREALVARGIPRSVLRARGLGAQEPIEGLPASDPANRRIEFSVIRTQPLHPTPIDTPGPR